MDNNDNNIIELVSKKLYAELTNDMESLIISVVDWDNNEVVERYKLNRKDIRDSLIAYAQGGRCQFCGRKMYGLGPFCSWCREFNPDHIIYKKED